MIRRLVVPWPDPRPFAARDRRSIRVLAVSDMKDPALEHSANREALGRLDGILGCGDLDPDWLTFLADAFNAPLVYVRGNHDRGGEWEERPLRAPAWLEPGRIDRLAGIAVVGLGWPGILEPGNRRRPWLAWRQAFAIVRRDLRNRLTRGREPVLVISHVPPAGVGDASDLYHNGFKAYRWLLDFLRPPVWIHGHTTTASVSSLLERSGTTAVANATGAVLLELQAPGA
jgi:Icc-related predicted phosphoesterase